MTTSTSSQMAHHLVPTTKALAATSGAEILFDQSVFGIDMASQIMLPLEVKITSRIETRKREMVHMNRHMGLELCPGRERLGAGGARIGFDTRIVVIVVVIAVATTAPGGGRTTIAGRAGTIGPVGMTVVGSRGGSRLLTGRGRR